MKRLEYLLEERLREVGLPRLEKRSLGRELMKVGKYLMGGAEKTEPGSFQLCPLRDQR